MIPFYTIFESQLDSFDDCDYPNGLIFLLRNNRLLIKNKLQDFFSNKKLTIEERREKDDWNKFLKNIKDGR